MLFIKHHVQAGNRRNENKNGNYRQNKRDKYQIMLFHKLKICAKVEELSYSGRCLLLQEKYCFMKGWRYLLLLFLAPLISESQIYIGFSATDSIEASKDTNGVTITANTQPDADRDDIPFIDYRQAVIWNTPADSICDYAYIRKNFTDQMVSVWKNPKHLYPASRVYAVTIEDKYYRSAKISEANYVFAEKIVSGEMDLYIYRKIPQFNGWIEYVGQDANGNVYHNNMIIENENGRSKKDYFGYFISINSDVLLPVSAKTLQAFSDTYLLETPAAKAITMKFTGKNMNKSRKIAVIGLMTIGIIGLASTGGSSGATFIFMLGFPAAAVVAYLNRPQTLTWQDMVEIVQTYNKEKAGTH
jgi:hypothetical protein